MPLVHHELCFGCGRTNLFGLLLELEETEPGSVKGRCFIKQDHQGPEPGVAHPGIVATALGEAMTFAAGERAQARTLNVEHLDPVPVGSFVEIEARVEHREDAVSVATAVARTGQDQVATGEGTFSTWRST